MARVMVAIAFVAVLGTNTASGQLAMSYGLKLGAASAVQKFQYLDNFTFPTDARWGFDVGAFAEARPLPYLSLVAEIHYVQKGFQRTLPITTAMGPMGTGEYVTIRPRADYLSFPVMAKLQFPSGLLTPYVFAGPRLDFLVSRVPDGFGTLYDGLKNTDVGVTFGVGVELPLSVFPSLLAEFRYSPSFTSAFKNDFLTVTNRSMEFLIGVAL